MFEKIINFCYSRPKTVVALLVIVVALAIFQLPKIKIDTDPENMLPANEHVRVFDHKIKEEFGLYDFIFWG